MRSNVQTSDIVIVVHYTHKKVIQLAVMRYYNPNIACLQNSSVNKVCVSQAEFS